MPPVATMRVHGSAAPADSARKPPKDDKVAIKKTVTLTGFKARICVELQLGMVYCATVKTSQTEKIPAWRVI